MFYHAFFICLLQCITFWLDAAIAAKVKLNELFSNRSSSSNVKTKQI